MYHQNKPRTIMEMRTSRWDSIGRLRSQVVRDTDEVEELFDGNMNGVVYRIPAERVRGYDLSDMDVAMLCAGREMLGTFKSVTREGNYIVCFIAEDIFIPDSTGGASGRGIVKAKRRKK
jgi:hypothetical protein